MKTNTLTLLLQFAGILHIGLIAAGASMPRAVNLHAHVATLPVFIRRLFYVYFTFIGLSLVGFGVMTFVFAETMAQAGPLATGLTLFLLAFWLVRLIAAAFVLTCDPISKRVCTTWDINAPTLSSFTCWWFTGSQLGKGSRYEDECVALLLGRTIPALDPSKRSSPTGTPCGRTATEATTYQTIPGVTMKPTKRIVLAGGSGFLGGILSGHFRENGYQVVVLTRKPRAGVAGEIQWDGETLGPWAEELNGAEAVINLAGRSVDCRYHARNRKLIMDSRIRSTRVLGEAIRRCPRPPRVWMNSSTATIYRHTFETAWDETGVVVATPEAKDAFSVEVAKAWEAAFNEQSTPATRKILLRSAMVLGASGSVFRVLRRLAAFGLGGRMGSGKQYVSWIHEHDFCRSIEWLLDHEDVSGVVNIAAPTPVPNAEMMKQLRTVCGLHIGLPASEWMLELGAFILRTETELMIKSRRVIPGRLHAMGFHFRYETFAEALKDLAARSRGV